MSRPGYYDAEATRYDETRGGTARADAAAGAVLALLPESARVVLDVAGGTGIVGARLGAPGRVVVSVDRSSGMSAIAATRLPGHVVLGDATRLPFADGSVDAVTLVWLLHLLDGPRSAAVVAEAARVLGPAGTLLATVDKAAAHLATPDDVGEVLGPAWRAAAAPPSDDPARIAELAGRYGLAVTGRVTFTGVGQGRTPKQWVRRLADPAAVGADVGTAALARLTGLPDQDRPRADPEFDLVALTRLG
ncbi:MAG TPA: methyltransferase domain-containing protein [Pseudonocardiaceae bacterium]|nr:methyltransferase domain-containing protein [Pseudonocardiaceae bacterium]